MNVFRENTESLADLCAANLTRLGRLYKSEGRFRAALEVLDLAVKLGSLEALAESIEMQSKERKPNRLSIAG